MAKSEQIVIGVAMLFFASQSFAANKLSDHEISQKLIGAWRVPPGSTDYDPETAHTVEIFKSDGTYGLYSFQEENCKALTLLASAKWTIKDGVLNSFYAAGSDQDDVVSLIDENMTLHSHSDGTTFTRVKISPCVKLTS